MAQANPKWRRIGFQAIVEYESPERRTAPAIRRSKLQCFWQTPNNTKPVSSPAIAMVMSPVI